MLVLQRELWTWIDLIIVVRDPSKSRTMSWTKCKRRREVSYKAANVSLQSSQRPRRSSVQMRYVCANVYGRVLLSIASQKVYCCYNEYNVVQDIEEAVRLMLYMSSTVQKLAKRADKLAKEIKYTFEPTVLRMDEVSPIILTYHIHVYARVRLFHVSKMCNCDAESTGHRRCANNLRSQSDGFKAPTSRGTCCGR